MPPEPFPWDRKDFLKDRKHERSEAFGSVARWRDSSHHERDLSHHERDFSRWGPGDFRRLPGHGRQRGWHMFPEEAGHGYGPSWNSGHKMLEDERGMPSAWRGDGKHGRNGRDSRSFSQKDWRVHSWDTNNGPRNSLGRSQYDVINDHRSNGVVTYPSHSQSDYVNSNEVKPKDSHDKIRNFNGLSAGQKYDKENSLDISDWRPMKWTRSSSLSSRGSGFSNSSSSKSLGVLDNNEVKSESLLKNGSFIQSIPSDVVCVTASPPCEDANSRKKPRLGWGEGLAKYEKKKVEDPDVCARKDAVFSQGNLEITHSIGPTLTDKNHVAGFLDRASPVTPVACSSSPVVDETSFGKKSIADNDISNLCSSPSRGQGSQMHLDGFSCILERIKELDTSSFANLGSSLTELLQSNDLSSDALACVRSAAINKLFLFKSEISKELELTESEIDSLENELKLMIRDSYSSVSQSDITLPLEIKEKHFKHEDVDSNLIVQSEKMQGVSATAREPPSCDDGPDIASSELVQPISQVGEVSPPNDVDSAYLGAICCADLTKSMPPSYYIFEKTDLASEVDGDLVKDVAGALGFEDKNVCAVGEDTSYDSILASNQEAVQRASEAFNKLLMGCVYQGISNLSSLKNNKLVEVKFKRRKQFLKFAERVVALKFEAFQQSWKEDMHLLSMRKSRTKAQKLSLRASNGGHQKNRASSGSRITSPGNVRFRPSADIIDYAGKLLSESQGKVCRHTLKMPALILDKKEKRATRFVSSNGLVRDPRAVEKERSMINPWTAEEREIFMDKLALFGKDFSKIASSLDHKTTADCVEFYYKNHKSDDFLKTKKKLENSENAKSVTNTYLVMLGKKWNHDINAASLDVLGEASAMVAYENDKMRSMEKCSSQAVVGELRTLCKDGRVSDQRSFDFVGNEKEAVAADVLAGICGSLSSEAMSSCVTSSIDPAEGYQNWKCKKVSSVVKRTLPSDIVSQDEDETCSDESCGELEPYDWTDEEKSVFVQALSSYGKDFVMISRCVRTRSGDQCKVFFSKARKCLGLDRIQTCGSHGTPVSGDDGNEGGSDIEDACVVETGSFTSGDKFCSKMDEDSRQADGNVRYEDSSPPEASLTNQWRSEENCESSTINHQDARILVSDVDQGKDKPVQIDDNRVVGVEESEGGLGDNLTKNCSESLGNELRESKKITTDNNNRNDLPCSVHVSNGKGTLLGLPSEHPCFISATHDKSSERDEKVESVHVSNTPSGNSIQTPIKRMDENNYLRKCSSKPQSASNELTYQLDQQDIKNWNGGNVKLFGKILNHASLQKSNVLLQNEDEETIKSCGKSKLTENHHKADGKVGFLKFDINSVEFDKLQMSYETCKGDAANAFAFPTWGQDGARLSHMTVQQDIFTEMQRRNGLDAISNLLVGLRDSASDHAVDLTKTQHAKADGEPLGDKKEDR